MALWTSDGRRHETYPANPLIKQRENTAHGNKKTARRCLETGPVWQPEGPPRWKWRSGKAARRHCRPSARHPQSLTAAALAGDVQAARLLLERALPPIKAVELAQAVAIPNEGSLTDQGRAVLAAVAAGELAPGQGAALLASIGTLARVVEVDELARRLDVLEAKNANG